MLGINDIYIENCLFIKVEKDLYVLLVTILDVCTVSTHEVIFVYIAHFLGTIMNINRVDNIGVFTSMSLA